MSLLQIKLLGCEKLIDGTAHDVSDNGSAACRRRLRACLVLSRFAGVLVLFAVLFLGPLATEAKAHASHSGSLVQMSLGLAEIAENQADADDVAENGNACCGIKCCATAGCTSAVLTEAHPSIMETAAVDSFTLAMQVPIKASPQSSLKRPPRI
jgi:hypothetical protein